MTLLKAAFFPNATFVRPKFFFISGFAGLLHANYYYGFLCCVYAVTVLVNTFVMFMIYTEHSLHTAKYIAVFNLALCDLFGSTAVIPQTIDTFLFNSQLITFDACLTNMFFVICFVSLQSFTLAVLSYDRCVAICVPLRYNEIVTNKSILVITTMLWIFAGMLTLVAVSFVNTLSFCQSTVVNSFFCDHGPIHYMACNDNTPSVVMNWAHPIMTLWIPGIFIIVTYICIARALYKISEATERLKAMKTCTSHLILVSVFYFPICFTYAMCPIIKPFARIINMSVTTILPPMLNPIIYSLKTEEFRETIRKLYRRKKIDCV
ncbi:olfactory receptor 51E2-like [Conger conger]|uniref:olfactory receptor 51E2-like n=1 Tax=Conger conger TaxID=82655 RepID=UPI002A5987C7|nr:olfactory receptor 51E2-like [Conger conger]